MVIDNTKEEIFAILLHKDTFVIFLYIQTTFKKLFHFLTKNVGAVYILSYNLNWHYIGDIILKYNSRRF